MDCGRLHKERRLNGTSYRFCRECYAHNSSKSYESELNDRPVKSHISEITYDSTKRPIILTETQSGKQFSCMTDSKIRHTYCNWKTFTAKFGQCKFEIGTTNGIIRERTFIFEIIPATCFQSNSISRIVRYKVI